MKDLSMSGNADLSVCPVVNKRSVNERRIPLARFIK